MKHFCIILQLSCVYRLIADQAMDAAELLAVSNSSIAFTHFVFVVKNFKKKFDEEEFQNFNLTETKANVFSFWSWRKENNEKLKPLFFI